LLRFLLKVGFKNRYFIHLMKVLFGLLKTGETEREGSESDGKGSIPDGEGSESNGKESIPDGKGQKVTGRDQFLTGKVIR
jgi:hypothetical protein